MFKILISSVVFAGLQVCASAPARRRSDLRIITVIDDRTVNIICNVGIKERLDQYNSKLVDCCMRTPGFMAAHTFLSGIPTDKNFYVCSYQPLFAGYAKCTMACQQGRNAAGDFIGGRVFGYFRDEA